MAPFVKPLKRGAGLVGIAAVLIQSGEDFSPTKASAFTVKEPALWQPLEAQPGRGLLLPDGRLVSPQQAALDSLADELFFGGAPGGGKSYLAIGAAITQHRNSIIFRRELSQLRGEEGLWRTSHDMIGVRGKPNEANFSWRELPGSRALEFGATGHLPQHWLKYKGRPHDLKCFDELPEIPEFAYRFLIAWLRTKYEGQRTRVISTGNPPVTQEGRWVIRYFAPWLDTHHPRPAQPGELRWFVIDGDGRDLEVPGPTMGTSRPAPVFIGGDVGCPHEFDQKKTCKKCEGRMVEPRSRTFIPASVEDNPFYMRTGYTSVLDNMPEPLRTLYRTGNFSASIPDDQWQVIPTAWVDAAQRRWVERGLTRKTAGLMTRAGNDPSRGGVDEFVVARLYTDWVDELSLYAAKEAMDGIAGANLVFKSVGDLNVIVQIDIGGSAGSSVYDQCRAQLAMNAVALNGSEGTKETDKSGKLGFLNKRAKWYWRMREALDPANGSTLCLPPDPQLKADLCATRWSPSHRGMITCEPKEIVKGRLGRSPDRGEAVIYACIPEVENQQQQPKIGGVWGSARRSS